MKLRSLIIAGLISISFPALAQTEVNLNINHMFNGSNAMQGEVYQVQGADFYYERIQYYMSDFVLIHDGGTETSLGDLVLLIDSDHGSIYDLGSHDIEEIEQIKFSVGVPQNLNHLDPSSYELSHPLAHQNPSMHWGWTSGYRFLCLDAYSGSDIVQIHALGDANFFSQTHQAIITSDDDAQTILLDANYDLILSEINVINGLYEHSETSESIVSALENMQNLVFSPGVVEVKDPIDVAFEIYPNPAKDLFMLRGSSKNPVVQIFDINGRLVLSVVASNNLVNVDYLTNGVYTVLIEYSKAVKLVVSK
tara:strand:- start:719 stop:1642 length:924 start_codon:yes stop_codon:yes gene_type:complete